MTIDRVRRERNVLYIKDGSEVTTPFLKTSGEPVQVNKGNYDSTLTKLQKTHDFVLGSTGMVSDRIYLTPLEGADTLEDDEMYWNPIGNHWVWK